MPRNEKTERLRDILPRAFGRKPLKDEYQRRLVIDHWADIVDDDIRRHTRPEKIYPDGTMIIAAPSVWANQLVYFKREIIDLANRYAAAPVVKDIRFAPFGDEAAENPAAKDTADGEKEQFAVDNAAIAAAHQAAEFIADGKLRDRIARAFAAHLTGEKIKSQNGQLCRGGCGVYVADGRKYCAACEHRARQNHYAKIREFYLACPWGAYSEVNRYEPCRPEEANAVRQELTRRQCAKVRYGDTNSLEAKFLVMLHTSLPPDKLTPAVMERTLFEMRFDLVGGPRPVARKNRFGAPKTGGE